MGRNKRQNFINNGRRNEDKNKENYQRHHTAAACRADCNAHAETERLCRLLMGGDVHPDDDNSRDIRNSVNLSRGNGMDSGKALTQYSLTINVSYDNFGERSLHIDSPVPAEKGIVKDIVKLLNSYIDGNES